MGDGLQRRQQSPHVALQADEHVLALVLQDAQSLHRRGEQEGRRGGGETVPGAGQSLVIHDLPGADAAPSDGRQGAVHGHGDDVYVRDLHPVVLRHPAARVPDGAEGERLVQDDAVEVLVLELHDLREGAQLARAVEEALGDDEAALLQRVALVLPVVLRDRLQDVRQVLGVVVLEVVHGASGQVDPGADGLAAGLVHDQQVPLLRVGGDAGRHRRRPVRVTNSLLYK